LFGEKILEVNHDLLGSFGFLKHTTFGVYLYGILGTSKLKAKFAHSHTI